MLSCIQCCSPCRICTDHFTRADSADVADGAPAPCEWSQSGAVSLVSHRVHINAGGTLSGPAAERVEVTVRATASRAIVEIAFGEVTGVVMFTNPAYIFLTGGLRGFARAQCALSAGVDYTFFLCLGALEADPGQPAAQFGIVDDAECLVGDTIEAGSGRTLSIHSVTGLVEIDDVKVERILSEEYPTCPPCVPDPPDPECLICRDEFNRADNSDVTAGTTPEECAWVDEGDASIASNWLRLPAGAILTGPSCDYVFFSARSDTDGAKLTVMIGDVGVTITFGVDESTMTILSPFAGGTTTTTLPDVTTTSALNQFVLCIGIVDKRAGVMCFYLRNPALQVSGQMNDNPTSTYGDVSFASTGVIGTVEVDSVMLYRRRTEGNEYCTYCRPNICAICSDYQPEFPASDCSWTNLGGFGYSGSDWIATGANATVVSGVGNPDGQGAMILAASWEWTTAIDSDTVRMRVAASADVGPYIEISRGGYYNGAGCTRLYSSTGELLSTVSNTGALTSSSLFCDGYGVWTKGTLTTNGDVLGRNNLTLPDGKATLGTGSSFDAASVVRFGLMSIDWYAASPWHTQCATDYRDCTIFSVSFPTGGGSDAGDPADVVNCHVDYTAGDWAADFGNHWWATIANDARITILTNHPDSGTSFTAVVTWTATVLTPESVDAEVINAKYPGLQLFFQHSGTAIVVEFLGWADGGLNNVWLWKITFNGGSGIAASAGAGAFAPIPHGLTACFGALRSRLSFAHLGFRDVMSPSTGNGTGIGIQSGASLYGPGDAALFVQGIAMQHLKSGLPNNEFTGVEPPACTDCDENHCPPCEDNTPTSLTVTIAPKAGADLSAMCGADVAVLSGTYVLESHLADCQYSIYLGPSDETEVPDYVDFIHNFDNESNCANYLGIKAEISIDGGGVRITVTAIGVTGVHIAWVDPVWSGTVALGDFDCESFSLALDDDMGASPWDDLFDVTVEYN